MKSFHWHFGDHLKGFNSENVATAVMIAAMAIVILLVLTMGLLAPPLLDQGPLMLPGP